MEQGRGGGGGEEISTKLHTSVDRFDWIASKVSRMPAKIEYPGVRLELCEFRATAHMFAGAPARTHAYFWGRGSRFFTLRSIFPPLSSFFFTPFSSSKSSSSLHCFRSLFPLDRCVTTGIKSWKSIQHQRSTKKGKKGEEEEERGSRKKSRSDACYNEREKEKERARGKVLITSSHVEPMPRNAMVAIARAGRFLWSVAKLLALFVQSHYRSAGYSF